jgi:uncharacterized protein (DUF2236 family)
MRFVAASSLISRRPPAVTTTLRSTAARRAIPDSSVPAACRGKSTPTWRRYHGGLPAIVLEILHPSVIAGVQDMSTYREDPFRRPRATLGYVLTTTFGNTEAATALIDHVEQIHSYLQGTRPDGVQYGALDPELIAWVHTCIPWMILRTFERTNRRLSDREEGSLPRRAGCDRSDGRRRLGADQHRRTQRVRAHDATQPCRQHPDAWIHRVPVDSAVHAQPAGRSIREVHRFAVHAGMSNAPRWTRELIGFDRPSLITRRLIGPYLHADARMLRWAFGTPRYVQLARQRVSATREPVALR